MKDHSNGSENRPLTHLTLLSQTDGGVIPTWL